MASRHTSSEWLGARYAFRERVQDAGRVFQPEVILWLAVPEGLLVGAKLCDPAKPVAFEQTLLDAMVEPLAPVGLPSKIRVPDEALAAAVRRVAPAKVEVVVAPVPELDAAFLDMSEATLDSDHDAGYLQDDIDADALRDLFAAAHVLYETAPWKRFSDADVFAVDVPAARIREGCLTVIGAAGESFGLLFFRSFDAYAEFITRGERLAAGGEPEIEFDPAAQTMVLSLSFERKRELTPPMLEEIKRLRLPIAGAKAYPLVFALGDDFLPRPLRALDLRLLSACAKGVVAFVAMHADSLRDPEFGPVTETFEDEMTVALTGPIHCDLDDEMEPEPIEAAIRVGRNEPCPCGSGRKYKKCHLNSDEPVTGVDRDDDVGPPLVHAICEMATQRFGKRWESAAIRRARHDDPHSAGLFIPWLAWTAAVDGQRVADVFLREHGSRLSRHERDWCRAEQQAWLSVWEVNRVQPGRIDLEDLLTGERRSVLDDAASQSVVARDTLLARIVEFRGTSYFSGLYTRALPPSVASQIVKAFAPSWRGDIERLRDGKTGWALIRRWRAAVEAFDASRSRPPVITNTDGDLLVFVTDTFRFDPSERKSIEARLLAMDDAQDEGGNEEEVTAVVFVREETVVGRAVIAARELRVETNSERRADTMRERVRLACADLLENPVRSAGPIPVSGSEPVEITPEEMNAIVRKAKEDHYRRWPDLPLPVLGGKTAREAARTKSGRAKVELLLRDMERGENSLPPSSRFDFGSLREELGLIR